MKREDKYGSTSSATDPGRRGATDLGLVVTSAEGYVAAWRPEHPGHRTYGRLLAPLRQSIAMTVPFACGVYETGSDGDEQTESGQGTWRELI